MLPVRCGGGRGVAGSPGVGRSEYRAAVSAREDIADGAIDGDGGGGGVMEGCWRGSDILR